MRGIYKSSPIDEEIRTDPDSVSTPRVKDREVSDEDTGSDEVEEDSIVNISDSVGTSESRGTGKTVSLSPSSEERQTGEV